MQDDTKQKIMYNTDEEMRKVALSLTHYIYRNTKLEDYHSECVTMDGAFYKKIYAIVYDKTRNVLSLHKFIKNYPNRCENEDDLSKLIQTVPEDLHLKFLRYFRELLFGFCFGAQWDRAQISDSVESENSLAKYILGGRFRECCDKGCRLDDETMCYINKDVHNRIYTLLVKGYFG